MSSFFEVSHVLVRPLSAAFDQAMALETPENPVDTELALKQHEAYVDLLRSLASSVIEVPPSDAHPDCCFIEDPAVFFKSPKSGGKKMVVINSSAAPSRRGEEEALRSTLIAISESRPSLMVTNLPNGTVDGGDILCTDTCVFVGKSKRTSKEGIESLKALLTLADLTVHEIPIEHGLHLKSCCSLITPGVIVVADNDAGRDVRTKIEALQLPFEFLVVPDGPASNVLRIKNHIVIQNGFPKSEEVLEKYAAEHQLTVHKLTMSEFIKVDGCLTCCSILIDV